MTDREFKPVTECLVLLILRFTVPVARFMVRVRVSLSYLLWCVCLHLPDAWELLNYFGFFFRGNHSICICRCDVSVGRGEFGIFLHHHHELEPLETLDIMLYCFILTVLFKWVWIWKTVRNMCIHSLTYNVFRNNLL